MNRTEIPVRKYIMIVGTLALLVVLGVSALLSGEGGKTMAEADVAGTSTGQTIENVASSKSTGSKGQKVGSVCRKFGSSYTCVPTSTPKGSTVTKLYEDGSSKYSNGSVFDPDTRKFRA